MRLYRNAWKVGNTYMLDVELCSYSSWRLSSWNRQPEQCVVVRKCRIQQKNAPTGGTVLLHKMWGLGTAFVAWFCVASFRGHCLLYTRFLANFKCTAKTAKTLSFKSRRQPIIQIVYRFIAECATLYNRKMQNALKEINVSKAFSVFFVGDVVPAPQVIFKVSNSPDIAKILIWSSIVSSEGVWSLFEDFFGQIL